MMDAVQSLPCDVLMFEFANREMAELELMAALAGRFAIAAGVIDVKNFLVEDEAAVARRIDLCLRHIPAEALWITADCGFLGPAALHRKAETGGHDRRRGAGADRPSEHDDPIVNRMGIPLAVLS